MKPLSNNRVNKVMIIISTLMILATTGNRVAAQSDFEGREQLRAHSEEFRKEVLEVAKGVYVAVGYSASNVTLIQSKDGSIIVDTSANPVDAQAIMEAFGKKLIKPVKAIIYTHNHPDHTGGASVFANSDQPDIYSHKTLVTAKPDAGRGMRDGGDAFGMALPDNLFINAGTQLEYGRKTPHTREGFLIPNQTFDAYEKKLTVGEIHLQLLHTPGETDENIAVWLPDQKVLLPGDNFYKSFPNISPIRGLPARPVEKWITSLNKMLLLEAEYLIPGHTRPILEKENVRQALTDYRDGIKTVFDQTMEGITKGMTPDELVQKVQLQPHLKNSPYLQEYYGSVAWTVRGIYAQKAGWFDGNATHLFPLTENDRAIKILALVGGKNNLLASADKALSDGEFQWAAEQTDFILAMEPKDNEALKIKAKAFMELGERQVNATARNYYLTTAQYLLNEIK